MVPLPYPRSPVLDMPLTVVAAAPEGRVFHTLDALRGIAAVGVVVFHLGGLFAPLAAPGGYLAVDLFFMMSGVVLSHAYEVRFRSGMGTFDFMRARLIRLYPLYLMGTVFGIAVTLASMHGRNTSNWDMSSLGIAAMLAVSFLPNFFARSANELFPLNIPCWSLFLEILVNLFFVVCWPWLTSRRLILICLLTGGALALAIVHKGDIDQGWTAAGFAVGLARTVFGFSVGVLIARRVPRARRAENSLWVLMIMSVVGVAIAGWPQGEWRATWDAVCVLLVFPLIVYLATLIDPGSWLRRLATFLGVTSYAVYVLHGPLASVLNSLTRYFGTRPGSGTGAPYTGIVVLALLLTGCWLIDRYFDMPVRRQLSRIIPRMPALRPAS